MKKYLLLLFYGWLNISAFAKDSSKIFTAYIETQINYGNTNNSVHNNAIWDIPHIVTGAEIQMSHSWTISAEFEFERIYEDRAWSNNFSNNFFYIAKQWTEQLNAKAGIVDVPVGLINSGGPALTIYDPESEACLVPMTWHENGITFYGSTKDHKLDYSLGALAYITIPFDESGILGSMGRLDYHVTDDLSVGMSAYYGNTHKGYINRNSTDYITKKTAFFGSFDAAYQTNAWTIDACALYCNNANAHSVGAETGYNILSLILNRNRNSDKDWNLIPFVRFDGIYNATEHAINKYTLGVNIGLRYGLSVKAQQEWKHIDTQGIEKRYDFSLNYNIEF